MISAILCSDPHLRDTIPDCRKGTYFFEEIKKLAFIQELQKIYDCPVICAGDVFDYWKTSPFLMVYALRALPDKFFAIPGQHDMPNHNYDMLDRSGFGLLKEAGRLTEIDEEGFGWRKSFRMEGWRYGKELPPRSRRGFQPMEERPRIAVCHSLTWESSEPFPGAVGNNAQAMLSRFPRCSLVLTGDNHKQFVYKAPSGQILVNPGSMMRMKSDQRNHRPAIYLWDAEANNIERMELPCNEDSMLLEIRERNKEQEAEVFSFVEGLQNSRDISLNFVDNLKQYVNKNQIGEDLQQKIWEVVE